MRKQTIKTSPQVTPRLYVSSPVSRLALFGMTLTEYGTHFKAIGRLDESERAFSRALTIAKQVLGPTHEQV